MKDFAPHQESLEMKELGFDEPCFGYFEPNGEFNYIESHILKDMPYLAKNSEWQDICGAPTFSQAFRWFRKNHGLYSSIIFKKSYPDNHVTGLEWYIIICGGDGVLFDTDGTYTYEEAELACLKKLIEIVKQPK